MTCSFFQSNSRDAFALTCTSKRDGWILDYGNRPSDFHFRERRAECNDVILSPQKVLINQGRLHGTSNRRSETLRLGENNIELMRTTTSVPKVWS